MKKQYPFLFAMLLIIVLIGSVSANFDAIYGKTNDNIVIMQTCSNATSVNITSIAYPDSSIAVSDAVMTSLGNGDFRYDFNLTQLDGTYVIRKVSNGCEQTFVTPLYISPTGTELSTAQAISYTFIFIIAFLVLIGLLIAGIYLPANNKSDEMTGYVIAISNMKYVKLLCFAFAYLTAMFISYFSWMTCLSYLNMDFVTDIFRIMFSVLALCILPLFIVSIYIVIANLVRDSKVGEMLSRGFKVR
jgi:hypothetical protein